MYNNRKSIRKVLLLNNFYALEIISGLDINKIQSGSQIFHLFQFNGIIG